MVRLTDRPDMTLDVSVDVKEQHNNSNNNTKHIGGQPRLFFPLFVFFIYIATKIFFLHNHLIILIQINYQNSDNTRSISPGARTDSSDLVWSEDTRMNSRSAYRKSIMRSGFFPLSVTWIFFLVSSNFIFILRSPSFGPTHSIAAINSNYQVAHRGCNKSSYRPYLNVEKMILRILQKFLYLFFTFENIYYSNYLMSI